jgi:type IV secretion system protein VirD4
MRDKKSQAGPQINQVKTRVSLKARTAMFLASLLGWLILATQVFAFRLGHSPALGGHFHHWYWPWKIIGWNLEWADQPHLHAEFLKAWGAGSLLFVCGAIGMILVRTVKRNSSQSTDNLHGSAKWATNKDIKTAGLLEGSGVYVGAWADKKGKLHYLRHSGPEHILTFAPTRSGKGVGLVIPTLLSWTQSAVITDLKGELWSLTAGWRKEHAGQKVLRFEPAALNGSVRWNPLDEIRLGTEHEVGDVQNLATLIVDPDGKGLEDHWAKTSQALFVGLILHVLYRAANGDGEVPTLPEVDRILADPGRPISDLWKEMTVYGHVRGEVHPVVGAVGRDMLDRPEREAGSVLSTTKSYLSLYRDPVVARNVKKSDFRIRDLMHHEQAVSLYIITQPNDKGRLRPLVRVMINMIIRLSADKMDFEHGRPKANYKHRLLLMMDEFPSLGKLEIMQESLAFVASYGVKCYLIIQDLSQLHAAYGKDESITSNCHIQNAFSPNRLETAEHLSKLTGTATVVKEQITTSGKRLGMFQSQVSTSIQEVQRPLLTPDEALRMPGPRKDSHGMIREAGDMVIYVAGFPAIYGKQPLYFLDKVFQKRAEVCAPENSDKIRNVHALTPAETVTL